MFYNVAHSTIHRLQTCSKAAALTVIGFSKYEHMTPVLHNNLHWLAAEQFKIAAMAFECIRRTCLAYFQGDLQVPRIRTVVGVQFYSDTPSISNHQPTAVAGRAKTTHLF
jgi:hypothetical protein